MTKPIKDKLRVLGVGLAMLPALANVAQAEPAPKSAVHHSAAHQALISQLAGKTIATATPQELASAVKQAIKANPKLAKAIVKAVFSQLGVNDSRKALAVIDAVQSVVPAADLAGLVRAAVEALPAESAGGSGVSVRSVLGPLVTQEASALAPSQATAIATAVGSILSSGGGGPASINFQGPAGVSNPANSSNSSGSVNSPSS
jgi:hypothetical protein